MKAAKTTLVRLGLYYLLLAINILPCASVIPDRFPLRNLSTLYLLFLSACLNRYYSYRVSGSGALPFMMRSLSRMAFLLLFLRGVKYSVFAGVAVLARHTWYLYYLPMLLLSLFFFYVALLIFPKGDSFFPKKWYWTGILTVALILLVLTNDWHQLVFRFQPGFQNWDNDYSRGLLFYLITAWQYILYLAAVLILGVKCRISNAKKSTWLTAIPFCIGITMSITSTFTQEVISFVTSLIGDFVGNVNPIWGLSVGICSWSLDNVMTLVNQGFRGLKEIKVDRIKKQVEASCIGEKKKKEEKKKPIKNSVHYDPAGYVYEAVASNRVEGVTVTCYYKDDDGDAVLWDASEADQINPQVTDENGAYQWFVPMGEWKVVAEKEGYLTANSENDPAAVNGWLPVPPPQAVLRQDLTDHPSRWTKVHR